MAYRLSMVADVEEACGPSFSRAGVKLHPQPTNDPLDPLNWTSLRKHSILGIVMWMYFMFTYITTTTVPSFPQIQKLYDINYAQVNLTVAIPSLGLAFGPLLWSSLSDIYGRRVVFIVGTVIAFGATVGSAVSKNYGAYMVARGLQGLGASPGGTVGMAIIGDLFFDYERGQKVGLWILAINSGLLVGPIIGGFIDLVNQFWVDWLTAVLFGALLIVELAFLPETLYPRRQVLSSMVQSKNSHRTGEHNGIEMQRTTNLPFINFRPIPGIRHPKPWDSIIRFGLTFRYPVVVLTVSIFCFGWYWWILSIITQIPAAYSKYSPSTQGLLFLGLLLGSWFAEIFCSGRLSDWLIQRLTTRNGGVRLAETRLWLAYPAALLSAVGLILWGISVDRQYHLVIGQLAFFLFTVGLQTGNTAISSYVLDCYPLQSMSIITFYSVILDLSALMNPFFIADWVKARGYTYTFVAQGMITFCVAVPVLSVVHAYSSKIRAKSGEPGWVNPEHEMVSLEVQPFLRKKTSIAMIRSSKGDKWKQVLGFDNPGIDLASSETISAGYISTPTFCHYSSDKWKRVSSFDEGFGGLRTVRVVPESESSDGKEILEDFLNTPSPSDRQFRTKRYITPPSNHELLMSASRPNPPQKDNKPLPGTPSALHSFLVSTSRCV